MVEKRSKALTTSNIKCDTLISLRDYIESRLTSQQMAIDLAKELMEARMTTSDKTLEQRLNGLNHLRSDIITKTEFASAHNALTIEFHAEAAGLRSEIAALKEWKAEQKGKASISSVYIAYVISLISFLLALVQLIHDLMTSG